MIVLANDTKSRLTASLVLARISEGDESEKTEEIRRFWCFCAYEERESAHVCEREREREVGGWGRDPKKCTGRDWGMGSSTI